LYIENIENNLPLSDFMMNEKLFKEKVLAPLEEWAHLGEKSNESGTRLIGHVPHVAPQAYINIVYPPLSEENFEEFEKRFAKPIPMQYRSFLGSANGLNIFSDAFRVMGYVPLKRSGTSVHTHPSNFMMSNVSARMKGLDPEDIIVGWYKSDGSYVLLNEAGKAIRFDAKGDGTMIKEWPDFDTWVTSEVAFLNQEYKSGNIEIFIPSTTGQQQKE
jgi:hypothetical protein